MANSNEKRDRKKKQLMSISSYREEKKAEEIVIETSNNQKYNAFGWKKEKLIHFFLGFIFVSV